MVTEHHEAIIYPKVFDHVQAELLRRTLVRTGGLRDGVRQGQQKVKFKDGTEI